MLAGVLGGVGLSGLLDLVLGGSELGLDTTKSLVLSSFCYQFIYNITSIIKAPQQVVHKLENRIKIWPLK